MSFQKQLNATLENVSAVGTTVMDLQMQKALLDEQRDRVAVADAHYVPGPLDGDYDSSWGALQVGGMSINPLHLAAVAAVGIYLVVRK